MYLINIIKIYRLFNDSEQIIFAYNGDKWKCLLHNIAEKII